MTDALIVIDMQLGSFGPDTPRFDTDGVVERINALAARARARGGLVIVVEHDVPPGDPHVPGSPGWQVLPALRREDGDGSIRKTTCDCFHDTDLEARLRAAKISRLFLTGCATDFCVDTTVRRAAIMGFETWAPSDGHTTADRPQLSAPQVIAHHNYVWADLIAPTGPVRVMSTEEILAGVLAV